jgi:hypothetical protein
MKKTFTFNPLGSLFAWAITVVVREHFPGNPSKNKYWIDGTAITDELDNPVDSELVDEMMEDIEKHIDSLVDEWYNPVVEDDRPKDYAEYLASFMDDAGADPKHYGTSHSVASRPPVVKHVINSHRGFGPTADVEAALDVDVPLWVFKGY